MRDHLPQFVSRGVAADSIVVCQLNTEFALVRWPNHRLRPITRVRSVTGGFAAVLKLFVTIYTRVEEIFREGDPLFQVGDLEDPV